MTRSLAVCFAALCLASPGHASTIFDATGTTANGSTLSGTVTIDTIGGTVTALDLTMAGAFSFNVDSAGPNTGVFESQYVIEADNGVSSAPFIDIFLPPATLAGYSGGNFCAGSCALNSTTAAASGPPTSFISGSLTAAAPEPASWMLMGAAMLGLVTRRIRRFVKCS
jgi:hypothetical protein